MSRIAIRYSDDLDLAKYFGFEVEYESKDWIRLRHRLAPKHNPDFALIIFKVVDMDSVMPNIRDDITNLFIKYGKYLKIEEINKTLKL